MLSSSEVMKVLGITKVTLYKWTNSRPPKIKAEKFKLMGRHYYGYSADEVKRVRALMKMKVKKGESWFKD